MLAALRSVLVASLCARAFGGACTPVDSCPKLSDGMYCPVNDVTEHADINRDVKLIKELLADGDYDGAKDVYVNGNESSKGAGKMRTLQGLAQKDQTSGGKYTNVFYSGALDLYGSIDAIWHDYIIACLDKGKSDDFRKYVINKALIGVVTAYATYELGAAVWKGEQGQTDDGQAAYAWDEGAAFHIGNVEPVIGDGYTGSVPGNLYSPYEFNWKRDNDFPDSTISTQQASVGALNYGLINLRGTYNAAAVESAQLAMYKIYSIAAIRSALKYSNKARDSNGNLVEKYLAEGWAYWRSASGYMSTINKTAVEEVDALLDLSLTEVPAGTDCKIKTLVESMYPELGITCAMVGTWKDAEAGSCLATACSDDGNTATLGPSSMDFVDMCKPVEIADNCHRSGLLGAAALAMVFQ
eukprot:Skav225187  [mRNA]  locus=scaffold3065:22022:31600:+ [translate_table: standard]